MKVTPTELPEVLLLEQAVFRDSRGYFMETYNQREFREATGLDVHFVQDNHSRSARGVLRGLHFQLPPHAQGKLVRVAAGRVFDVAVDLRRSSERYRKWAGIELSAENLRQLWIPPGFAHGFLVLSESADLLYKTTEFFAPAFEQTLRWNDKSIGIQWPLESGRPPLLSDKDAAAPSFAELTVGQFV